MDGKIYSLFVIDDNGQAMELQLEDIDLSTIYSRDSLSNIESKKDNITKDFQLKGTKHNNLVLGNLYDLSRFSDGEVQTIGHNFISNKYIKCKLFENNVQIMQGSL